ncbi:MAG: hypothetical protein J6O00_04715 [Clostridiales bacterium]|nr:hypothetical protein [Clostridiales bacterium]
MKKAISLIVGASLLFTLAGCSGEVESPAYDEEIFVCDPDNMFGLTGIYKDGDDLILEFDEDSIGDEPYNRTLDSLFDRGELYANDSVYILTDGDGIVIDTDDVAFDEYEYIITISEDIDTDEMTGIELYIGGTEYTIDINEETLSVLMWGGECSDTFTQEYNSRNDSWSNVDHEQQIYPMTYESGAQPDVEPVVAGRFITPFTAEYIPDEWMPELDQYLFGMIDLMGNVIYEPQFAHVRYIESCGAYIVGGEADGAMRYGIMDDDGEEFTGLIYDGAYYDTGMTEDESGHFYMTAYNDGILHVTTYDDDLDITDDSIDITVDEDALPYEASNLAVCHMHMNGALIRDISEFYPHNVLIDVETGEVLHDFANSFGDERIFGDLIIDADRISEDVQIYSYDGELIFDDDDATGFLLDDYRFALAFDDTLVVIDRDGDDHASIHIDSNATVDQGCGVIGVTDSTGTTFYDGDLNVIAEAPDVDLDDGYLSGRFSDGMGGNIIFVSFDEDTITNFANGAVMDVNDDCFYSHERDYIFADDMSNGNLSEHHWYLYDNEFNLVLEGDDYGDVLYDSFTDDMYVSEYTDGVTTVYSLDTYEPVLGFDGRCSVRIIDGNFLLTGDDEVRYCDCNGDILFESEISH